MHTLPDALRPMAAYRQFIVYTVKPGNRPGKTDKLPVDFRSGAIVSAHDPRAWTDADTAIAAAATFGHPHGVGFVFTPADPFWFFDIDDCLDQSTGQWSDFAVQMCQAFAGAAIEVSHSGRGLHIFGTGSVPPHSCKNVQCKLEFYHADRFVALTGTGAVGSAAADMSPQIAQLVGLYFQPDQSTDIGWTDGPVDDWRGPSDDDRLIERAMRSRSAAAAFGPGRASFADLWTGNVDALARAWPADGRAYDASSADAALAQHLAFWTGKDCERIRRLMERSALVREKWARDDYLPRTITAAVGRQVDVLTDKATEQVALPPAADATPKIEAVTGSTFVTPDEQIRLFDGCVYIRDSHRAYVPGGYLMKPEQFRVQFGGYSFCMDSRNERLSRDAWEAFTQNQAFRAPRVDADAFRPDMPPGCVLSQGGRSMVNTFWPLDIERKPGDATLFLAHLRKLLPTQRDADILLCYMAAVCQHQGVKFKWAPLLQGVEGNGKTLFSECLTYAIGDRYCHWPRAQEIGEKFNTWIFGKIFIAVEDVFVKNGREEIFEILKPMITGEKLERRAMQTDQTMCNLVANFIFNSNHKDGMRKTKNDRRIAPLFCAQQSDDDLIRDGLTNHYFNQLYGWLKSGGFAVVAELLYTMPIPDELNPAALCKTAPITSSTGEAIAEGRGLVEQYIIEAIEQGQPGFCGGWVSSLMLAQLLEKLHLDAKISHSRRKAILSDLGYVPHPGLIGGRVNNMVLPDGGRSVLFVRRDSPAMALRQPSAIAREYEACNQKSFTVN